MRLIHVLTALLLGPATASAGGVAIFQGPPAGPGDVLIVDPAGLVPPQAPPGLQGVRLLPFELNGRTQLGRFLPAGVWLETDVPGAARGVLPAGEGSLYHFARPAGGGGEVFGFFVVDELGEARVVVERPGTGAGGDVDPFGPRPALAPDGRAMLVATTPAAGGDLLEVDLELATALVRTPTLPPQAFSLRGLALHASWGVAVTDAGVLRFDRAGAGAAAFVPFPAPTPTWFQGDVVLSPNGLFAATIAGDVAPLGRVWSYSLSGPAAPASATAGPLSGAGFLPETAHGPFLAVSDDGGTCAWRTEGLKREAWLARVQPPAGQGPQQITADAYFMDTLDEIGEYVFRPGSGTVLLAVGALSTNLPLGLESADFFEVSLDANGQPQFVNLTLTSGLSQPPFNQAPTISPVVASWTPAGDALLVHDDDGNGRLLVVRPGQPGLQVLLPDVKDVDRIDRSGSDFTVVMRRAFDPKDREIHLLPAGLTGATIKFFSAPDTDEVLRCKVRPDGAFAFVQTKLTSESLWIYDKVQGQLHLLTPRPLVYGPTLGVGPGGELAFSVGLLGNPAVFAQWPYPSAAKRLLVPVAPGYVLPGA